MAMKNTWKKVLALLMALTVFCLPLASCQSGETEDGGSSKASSKESSENSEKESAKTLRVLTDKILYTNGPLELPNSHPSPSLAQKALREIVEHFGGTPNGLEIELEVLPSLDNHYDAELAQVRVELMAGKGPDVFLMSGFGAWSLYDDVQPVNTLFMNPEAAMKRNMFLALDEYMENVQIMEPDKLLPVVMEAGKYDGKQYIMPMTYNLPMGVVRRQVDEAQLPANWDEARNSDIDDVRWSYAVGLEYSPGFRNVMFEQVADNLNETMLIDQDEFFQRTKEACDLYSEYNQNAPSDYMNCGKNNQEHWRGYWEWEVFQSGLVNKEQVQDPLFLPRNAQGGFSAGIENWCAVNANTEHPEDAFFLVDIFMSKEFQCAVVFWDTQNFVIKYPILHSYGEGGLPVYSELLTKKKGGYGGLTLLGNTQRAALREAQENITCVYFTSKVDREMDHMFRSLIDRIANGETLSDNEIRKEADKCYSTMKLLLGES